ncbi:hypothetical protein B0T17DRAFT_538162 [Bombardia bombarda]|uniref:Uncharacterized protein n=1 Tax=Bombardia bombarda TaxID=252184 RepID=A0AA40BYV6_9PEZI|nr:hypothetical protein B0T17DRAFT_538162 [Bombardia bombarda]
MDNYAVFLPLSMPELSRLVVTAPPNTKTRTNNPGPSPCSFLPSLKFISLPTPSHSLVVGIGSSRYR